MLYCDGAIVDFWYRIGGDCLVGKINNFESFNTNPFHINFQLFFPVHLGFDRSRIQFTITEGGGGLILRYYSSKVLHYPESLTPNFSNVP